MSLRNDFFKKREREWGNTIGIVELFKLDTRATGDTRAMPVGYLRWRIKKKELRWRMRRGEEQERRDMRTQCSHKPHTQSNGGKWQQSRNSHWKKWWHGVLERQSSDRLCHVLASTLLGTGVSQSILRETRRRRAPRQSKRISQKWSPEI